MPVICGQVDTRSASKCAGSTWQKSSRVQGREAEVLGEAQEEFGPSTPRLQPKKLCCEPGNTVPYPCPCDSHHMKQWGINNLNSHRNNFLGNSEYSISLLTQRLHLHSWDFVEECQVGLATSPESDCSPTLWQQGAKSTHTARATIPHSLQIQLYIFCMNPAGWLSHKSAHGDTRVEYY